MLLFLKIQGEPKTHLPAVFGAWNIDGVWWPSCPQPQEDGAEGHLHPQSPWPCRAPWGWPHAGEGPWLVQAVGRPGPDGMVPWRQGQGHGQLWPELCFPRSDSPMVMSPPSTGAFLPRRRLRGQVRLGQQASCGGGLEPLRSEAGPSCGGPGAHGGGGSPRKLARSCSLSPASSCCSKPATQPCRGAGRVGSPDPGELWRSLHQWSRAAAGAHGHWAVGQGGCV